MSYISILSTKSCRVYIFDAGCCESVEQIFKSSAAMVRFYVAEGSIGVIWLKSTLTVQSMTCSRQARGNRSSLQVRHGLCRCANSPGRDNPAGCRSTRYPPSRSFSQGAPASTRVSSNYRTGQVKGPGFFLFSHGDFIRADEFFERRAREFFQVISTQVRGGEGAASRSSRLSSRSELSTHWPSVSSWQGIERQ